MKGLSIKQALVFTLLLLGLCISRQASALSCREGSNAGSWVPIGSIYQRIDIGRPIILSAADFTAGNLIWRSQNFSTTFTCWDNWNTGRENMPIFTGIQRMRLGACTVHCRLGSRSMVSTMMRLT